MLVHIVFINRSVVSKIIRDIRTAERKFRDGIKRAADEETKKAWPPPPELLGPDGKKIDYYSNYCNGPILEAERETKMVEWYTVVAADAVKTKNQSKKERACWL